MILPYVSILILKLCISSICLILCLAKPRFQTSDYQWDVQEVEPQTFILRSRGIPTNSVDEGVGASIVNSPPPTLWRVRQAVKSGENMYL